MRRSSCCRPAGCWSARSRSTGPRAGTPPRCCGCAPVSRSSWSTVAAAGPPARSRPWSARTSSRSTWPRSSPSRRRRRGWSWCRRCPRATAARPAVETMTELGVDEIVPWAASRCVTKWRDGRGEKALERWRTTAQAAAKQSRRARFPVVTELAGTRDVVDRLRRAAAGVVLHEEAEAAAGRAPASGYRRGRGRRRPRGRASAPRSWP